MQQFGITVEHDNYQVFYIHGNQTYTSPGKFLVEGDASSASYFLAAGAIKGKVRVTGIGKNSIQGDIGFRITSYNVCYTKLLRLDHLVPISV